MIAHRADVEWCSTDAELDINVFRSAHSWAGETKQTKNANTTKIHLEFVFYLYSRCSLVVFGCVLVVVEMYDSCIRDVL